MYPFSVDFLFKWDVVRAFSGSNWQSSRVRCIPIIRTLWIDVVETSHVPSSDPSHVLLSGVLAFLVPVANNSKPQSHRGFNIDPPQGQHSSSTMREHIVKTLTCGWK